MIKLRVPNGFFAALDLAASKRYQSVSEYSRQVLLDAVHADGVRIHPDGSVDQTDRITHAR